MLQLHLSDRQSYCLLRYVLFYRVDGIHSGHWSLNQICCLMKLISFHAKFMLSFCDNHPSMTSMMNYWWIDMLFSVYWFIRCYFLDKDCNVLPQKSLISAEVQTRCNNSLTIWLLFYNCALLSHQMSILYEKGHIEWIISNQSNHLSGCFTQIYCTSQNEVAMGCGSKLHITKSVI